MRRYHTYPPHTVPIRRELYAFLSLTHRAPTEAVCAGSCMRIYNAYPPYLQV